MSSFTPQPNWTLISQGAEARLWKIPDYRRTKNARGGGTTTCVAVAKERFSKSYRHPVLDERLTVRRCRTEARLLEKCGSGKLAAVVDVPAVLHAAPPVLYVEYVEGVALRCFLEEQEEARASAHVDKKQKTEDANGDPEEETSSSLTPVLSTVAHEMGTLLAKLHYTLGIVHGDLTTSNMMLRESVLSKNSIGDGDSMPLTLIDFGLAKNSQSAEERAVDLYVLERALQSTHAALPEQFWETALAEYAAVAQQQERDDDNDNKKKNRKKTCAVAATLARLEQVRQRGRKRECFG
jgi:TP53 regulating kinase-like protein